MQLTSVIEALLVASEDPLATSEIARLIRASVAEAQDQALEEDGEYAGNPEWEKALAEFTQIGEDEVISAIAKLNQEYESQNRAFTLLERTKGWKIYTKPEYSGIVRQLFPGAKPKRLSGPAMETLAIIAYRQPVTKAAMEAVRGVSCDGMLQKLLDLELIKIEGRAELPGRPLLYATTDYFFEHFGIKSVDELPNASELRHVPLPEPEPEETESEEAEEQLALDAPSEESPPEEEPSDPGFADPTEPQDATSATSEEEKEAAHS